MTVMALGDGVLLQVILVALGAGIGVTVIFALAIVGAVQARDARRERRAVSGVAWGVLSLVATLGVVALVLVGIGLLAA